MLEQIKAKLGNPDFQRQAAHVAGGVFSLVASAVVSNLISKGVSTGIDKMMDKIHPTQVTPAE